MGTWTVKDPHHPALYAMRQRARDHFTEGEIQALLGLQDLEPAEMLILRILVETGLRRRAVAWLTVDGVYDRVQRRARDIAGATEKGLVMRSFVLIEGTQHTAGRALFVRRVGPVVWKHFWRKIRKKVH